MAGLDEGDKLPDFTLPADGGRTMSLASYKGKRLVLFCYPKDDSTACTTEAQDFTRLAGDFAKAGVAIAGLSPDSAKKHDKFKAKQGIGVDLIADEEKTLLDALGTWQEKSMYGRKYMGVVRSTFLVGPDGTILKAWRNVSVTNHAQDVLDAVRSL